jgi:hypothetical protein
MGSVALITALNWIRVQTLKYIAVEKLINDTKEQIAIKHGYPNNVLGTAWEYAMQLTHRTKKQIELHNEVACALAKRIIEDAAILPINSVAERYVIRDWMVAEVYEFDNYEDARRKYDELINEGHEETDIELYKILDEYNNVD